MTLKAFSGRVFGLALAAAVAIATNSAQAQTPSPGAVAAAKELIALKGASNIFDPVVPGVVETVKATFLRTNPGLAKDLNEVAAVLRKEFATRRGEMDEEMARTFAAHFTEQELREAIVFYKTPLGRKLITQEAAAMDQGMQRIQTWADNLAEEVLSRMRAEMLKRGHRI
ncbi:MAG TPA: DUF2059 domain-containing protein [Xanthobacteraceae bacterium]|nr:DUF2059 domain-containing protein [Xanthobacteraceae bacterium]